MQYIISFPEGIITFISPCLLPILPTYIFYFPGGSERSTRRTLTGALGFVLGFTVVFVAMGALAGTLGSFLKEYQTPVNIVFGLVVTVFGMNYPGVLQLDLFRGSSRSVSADNMEFFPLFGMIFFIGWTPCVGAFPGFSHKPVGHAGAAATSLYRERTELRRKASTNPGSRFHCV